MKHDVHAIANYHCRCGENPLWDDRAGVLYWTDIPAGRLYQYDPSTGRHGVIYDGDVVGGFTLQADGTLLLFGENRIMRRRHDGTVESVAEGIDGRMDRFNDVMADPSGRVYAGTMAPTAEDGGLYRIDLDGAVTCLFRGTTCSNGMGFSPDGLAFYWTDTIGRTIHRFDYDRDSGELTGRAVAVSIPESAGLPDGMTVDTEGNLWSARWGGWAVVKFSPAGEELDRIALPVEKVSSVTFGGADLDELYITTAGGKADKETPDGTVYRVRVSVGGRPEFRSRILLP